MRILSTRAKNRPGVVSVPRFNKKNSERERARVNTKTTSGLRREKTAHEFSQATLTTSRFFSRFSAPPQLFQPTMPALATGLRVPVLAPPRRPAAARRALHGELEKTLARRLCACWASRSRFWRVAACICKASTIHAGCVRGGPGAGAGASSARQQESTARRSASAWRRCRPPP